MFDLLWPGDATWPHTSRTGSTLVQVMACCLTAPNQSLPGARPTNDISIKFEIRS